MIQISELTKRIGEKTILKGINLTVNKGETIAFLGPNGAGKSTILNILSGLVKPSSGVIKIDELYFKDHKIEIKKKIGFLAHDSYLYDYFSALENLMFFGRLYQVPDIENRAKKLIQEIGLNFFINDPVRTFSRGMIQRLAIARAMLHSPQVLLLDEPFTGLDQQGKNLLNNMIFNMKANGTTTIFVTHDIDKAVTISDRIMIIKGGQLADNFSVDGKTTKLVTDKYMRLVEER